MMSEADTTQRTYVHTYIHRAQSSAGCFMRLKKKNSFLSVCECVQYVYRAHEYNILKHEFSSSNLRFMLYENELCDNGNMNNDELHVSNVKNV